MILENLESFPDIFSKLVDNSEYYSLELSQSYERKKIVSDTPHTSLEDFAAADMPYI